MLKLTDALTGKPCYVFGEVTGVQPMLASTAGVVPSRMVATTRVWYGCACVDVRESVDEVLALVGNPVDAKLAGLMNDALDAIWFRVPLSEMRPDRAWNRDRPMEVLDAFDAWRKSVVAFVDARDVEQAEMALLHARDERLCTVLSRILDLAMGDDYCGTWSLDEPETVVRLVRERMVRRDPCTACATPTCLHDNGCAHGHVANDVPAATEREIKRFIPPMQVISLAVVDKVVNPDTAFANGGFTPARPGCYTTDPVSAHACKGYGDTRCEGCTGLSVEADTFAGITVVADPTIPPDQVVMRSHTVDGKLLDEVRVVNVATNDDPAECTGCPVIGFPDADDCEKCTRVDENTKAAAHAALHDHDVRVELVPGVGPVVTEIDDDEAIECAFDVHRELDLTDRRALSMLANHGPQTALRLAGLCGVDTERSPAPVMVVFNRIVGFGLVEVESRPAEEESGKARPDLLKLTPLGRDVARYLRGE